MHFAQIRQGEGVGAAGGTQHQHLGAAPGKGLRLLLSGAGGAADGVVDHQIRDAPPKHVYDLLEGLLGQGGLGHQAALFAGGRRLRLRRALQDDGPAVRPAGGADDLGMGPFPCDVDGYARLDRRPDDGMDPLHEGAGGVHGADAPSLTFVIQGRWRAVGPDDQGVPRCKALQAVHGQDALGHKVVYHALVVDQLPPGVHPAPLPGLPPGHIHRPAHAEAEPGVLRHDDPHTFRLCRGGISSSVSTRRVLRVSTILSAKASTGFWPGHSAFTCSGMIRSPTTIRNFNRFQLRGSM